MNSNMKRIIASFLLVILAFIVQTCIFPLLPFLAVYPNLMVILVFSFGFIRGSAWGMGYGLIVGLLMDLSSGGPLGFHTLVFIWMGYVNGICTKYYYEDYITLPLVLSALNEVFYNFYLYVFGFLVRGRLNFGYYFINIILPETKTLVGKLEDLEYEEFGRMHGYIIYKDATVDLYYFMK